jgi:hypothetical protein
LRQIAAKKGGKFDFNLSNLREAYNIFLFNCNFSSSSPWYLPVSAAGKFHPLGLSA